MNGCFVSTMVIAEKMPVKHRLIIQPEIPCLTIAESCAKVNIVVIEFQAVLRGFQRIRPVTVPVKVLAAVPPPCLQGLV